MIYYCQTTGTITAKVSFDREAKDVYSVKVTATDQGNPKRSGKWGHVQKIPCWECIMKLNRTRFFFPMC